MTKRNRSLVTKKKNKSTHHNKDSSNDKHPNQPNHQKEGLNLIKLYTLNTFKRKRKKLALVQQQPLKFSDDSIYEILSFLDCEYYHFIFKYALISKQWFNVIKERCDNFKFSLICADESKLKGEFLHRIESLLIKSKGGARATFHGNKLSEMTNLTKLEFTYAILHLECAQKLSQLQNLTYLNLSDDIIKPNYCKYIGKLTNLTELDLKGTNIGIGIKYLKNLKELKILKVGSTMLSDECMEYIYPLEKLKHLSIEKNYIDKVYQIENLKNLTFLNIVRNLNERYNLKNFESISKLENLTILNIYGCQLNEQGCKLISKLRNLTNLNIGGNNIGIEGVKYLTEMKQLKYLYIDQSEINVEFIKIFKSNSTNLEFN